MRTSSKLSESNFTREIEQILNSLAVDIIETRKTINTLLPEVQPVADLQESQRQVENILLKFHLVARELANRHDDRTPFDMNDEYDVQDLLEGLLRLHFDDVRREDPTPILAGSSTRIDFVLAQEKIGIEAKRTSAKLRDGEIGRQLINDIEHYKEHPSCMVLYFFVYDPEEYIANPHAIVRDLSKRRGNMDVRVFILPRRI